jgi:hypothetical protein
MKKILFVLMIAMITKTADAQQNKHVEVILSDSIVSNFDTAYWNADFYFDYSLINLDSSILKQKNPRLENTLRRSMADDTIKKVIHMLNLEVKNMKDVKILPDLIFDNYNYTTRNSFSYLTTSYSGIKNLIDYCDSKKINLTLFGVKSNTNDSAEILLRKKLLERSRKIALASLPSFNGKSLDLLSISQTEPISRINYGSSIEVSKYKQLLNDNINFKIVTRLTLKFDYLVK